MPESLVDNLDQECSDMECRLEGCWNDSDDSLVCRVEFSFMSTTEQKNRLQHIVRKSVDDRKGVVFCGVDSPGTDIAAAVFVLLIVVLLIAALDSSGHHHSSPNFTGFYFNSFNGSYETPTPDYRCPAGTRVSVESRT